jgi:putative ABC transport system permease protein
MISFLRTLGRNLSRNRARHAATFFVVALGTAGLNGLAGYVIRWENTLKAVSIYLNNTGTVAVFKRGGHKNHLARPLRFSFTHEEKERILAAAREQHGVEAAAPVLRGQGLASNGTKTFPFVGIGFDPGLQRTFEDREDVQRWAAEHTHLESGEPLWQAASENPVGLAKGLGVLLAEREVQLLSQGFEGNFSAIDAQVVHTYSTGVALLEDSRMRMSLAAAERLFDTRGASWVAIFLRDPSLSRSFAVQFENVLSAQGLEVDVIPWQDERVSPFYVGVMNFLFMMAGSFFLLIAGVVALAVVNSVFLTTLERFQEMGTLRAVGYLPGRLALGFAGEVFFLSVAAASVGIGVSFAVSGALNASNVRFRPPGFADTVQFMLTPNAASSLLVGALVVLVAGVAAFLAALRTASLPVVTLLGEERN